jgi:transglutaminase-like putative cysteine protease
MKKIMIVVTTALLLAFSVSSVFAENNDVKVNTADATVEIHASTDYSNYKAIVKKGAEQYIYNLVSEFETLPLQMGSGRYDISILGSNDGRRYKLLSKVSIDVTLEKNAVFLSSSQTVDWHDDSDVAKLAKKLTRYAKTDQDKVEIIYDYVINNVKYDYDKAEAIPRGYIPNADSTLAKGSGICYDFAALTASMLRAVDIPTKLVKGYSSFTNVYHAWNEVLVDGEWIVMDTSTDSIYVSLDVNISMEKAHASYVGSKEY